MLLEPNNILQHIDVLKTLAYSVTQTQFLPEGERHDGNVSAYHPFVQSPELYHTELLSEFENSSIAFFTTSKALHRTKTNIVIAGCSSAFEQQLYERVGPIFTSDPRFDGLLLSQ